MSDCGTCKYYTCDEITTTGIFTPCKYTIIRIGCEKDCKKMMVSSYDCKEYEPNNDDNKNLRVQNLGRMSG